MISPQSLSFVSLIVGIISLTLLYSPSSYIPLIHCAPPSPSPPSSSPLLLHLYLLHRHGARAPISPLLSRKSLWHKEHLSAGSITPTGISQLQFVGKSLFTNYSTLPFLHSILNPSSLASSAPLSPNVIYSRSTDVDRCLLSASALLSTLLPNGLYKYLPTHTVAMPTDKLLQPTDKCPIGNWDLTKFMGEMDEKVEMFLLENGKGNGNENISSILSHLSSLSPPSSPSSPGSLSWSLNTLSDNLLCEHQQGLHGDWDSVTAKYYEKINNFVRMLWNQRFGGGVKEAIERGRAGNILYEDYVNNIIKETITPFIEHNEKENSIDPHDNINIHDDPSNPSISRLSSLFSNHSERLRHYSAHDSTIVSFLSSMGKMTDDTWYSLPPFGTTVGIELYYDDKNEKDGRRNLSNYFVSMWIGYPKERERSTDNANSMYFYKEEISIPCPMDSIIPSSYFSFDTLSSSPSPPIASPPLSSLPYQYHCPLPSFIYFSSLLSSSPPLSHPPSSVNNPSYLPTDKCCRPPSDYVNKCLYFPTHEGIMNNECLLYYRMCHMNTCEFFGQLDRNHKHYPSHLQMITSESFIMNQTILQNLQSPYVPLTLEDYKYLCIPTVSQIAIPSEVLVSVNGDGSESFLLSPSSSPYSFSLRVVIIISILSLVLGIFTTHYFTKHNSSFSSGRDGNQHFHQIHGNKKGKERNSDENDHDHHNENDTVDDEDDNFVYNIVPHIPSSSSSSYSHDDSRNENGNANRDEKKKSKGRKGRK